MVMNVRNKFGARSWQVAIAPALLGVLAASFAPTRVGASLVQQADPDTARSDTLVYVIDPVVVTATRTARPVSETPAPVNLVDQVKLREQMVNTVTDLFRNMPGLDVNGVGVNQVRPIIRGQRGQRILLMQDGIRLNNSRRQQDFGELPALVDVKGVERVEVVRGPSSVLYGTDAIGGVVNIVTPSTVPDGVHGTLGYRYGSAGEAHKGTARFSAGFGDLQLMGGYSYRDAASYSAPKGDFGNISLVDDVTVNDTGVRDQSFDLRLGYRFTERHSVFAKGEIYRAEDAGFGWVDPADYAPELVKTVIQYPTQSFDKLTFGYSGQELGNLLADRLDFTGYVQGNEREFTFDLFVPFAPGVGIQIDQKNYTDIGTYGLRLEAKKLARPGLLFTYGVDLFRDKTENADTSVTTLVGMGPPMPEIDPTPNLPNASYRSMGAFLQGEAELGGRATLILGGRVQDVKAETRATPDLPDLDDFSQTNFTAVGAANLIVKATPELSFIGSLGRAFRAPNLIELLFEGPTAESGAWQVRNPDLKAETSLNVDIGARYVNDFVFLEAFYFRNKIYDGIRIQQVPDSTIQGQDVFQNVNLDELLFRGWELSGDVYLPAGIVLGSTYTWTDTKNLNDPDFPVGESFSSKLTGRLRYQPRGDRFWAEYAIRHNGEQKDVDLGDANPVGDVLPSFTTHDIRGGATLFRTRSGQTGRILLAVMNITDELYAEFSNAGFFRPEPKRNLTLSMEWSF